MGRHVFPIALLLSKLSLYFVSGILTPSEHFPRSIELIPGDVFHLFWKYDKNTITFEVHAKTHGYVGLGISPGGSMAGADIALGWIKDGKIFFKDMHALQNGAPKIDPHQDWELLSARETSTHTIFKYKRKLVTCDAQDVDITDGTTRLIFSYHDKDPTSEENLPWHGRNHGAKSVFLLTPKSSAPLPPDVKPIDFLSFNHTIPHDHHTYYYCQGFSADEMPILTKKHHFIKLEPIIQKGHEGLVHHILLYACPKTIVGSHHGLGYNCYGAYYGEKQPPVVTQLMTCSNLMAAWAVGGQDLTLPDGVGALIGGLGDGHTGSFMIEIHYDNPTKVPGIQDISGLRFWITPKLRKIQAGILMTGATVTPRHIIPPHATTFRSIGYCSKECTSDFLAGDPGGIKVFSVCLHGHLTTTQVRVHHFRNGTELRPISQDNTYDFNFQDFKPILPEPVTILPGDDIMTECISNTKNRAAVTWGGLSTVEEMCLSFLYYYPKKNVFSCLTNPTWGQILNIVDGARLDDPNSASVISNPKLTAPFQYAGKRATTVLSQLNWKDDKMVAQIEYWMTASNASLVNTCDNMTYQGHPSNGRIIQGPTVVKSWQPPASPCVSKPTSVKPSVGATPTSTSPARQGSGLIPWATSLLVLANSVICLIFG